MSAHPYHDTPGPDAHLDPRGPQPPILTEQVVVQMKRSLGLEAQWAARSGCDSRHQDAKALLAEWTA